MRLEKITLYHLRRALSLYLEQAFRAKQAPVVPQFEGPPGASVDAVLGDFLDESGSEAGGVRCYALRLGNERYPFMKLRLLEYLVRGEFFLAVDTHDQMFADEDDPDLAKLKVYNRELKQQIECAWEGAGLPTMINLKGTIGVEPLDRAPKNGICILLVDDDPAIQDTLALLLESQGYDVDRASDGEEAVELADASRHSLILMDVEMPRMSGIEACEVLKDDPDRCAIPILLASAGAVELARQASPDGFLVKPFHADALFKFLDTLLGNSNSRRSSSSR